MSLGFKYMQGPFVSETEHHCAKCRTGGRGRSHIGKLIYVWNRQIVRESLHLFCGRTLRNHRLKDSPKVMQEFSALVGNLTSNMLEAKLITTSFFCSGSRGTKCFRIGIYLWHILTLLFLLQNLEGFVTLLILFVENKCMTPDAKFFPCYTNRSECSVPS